MANSGSLHGLAEQFGALQTAHATLRADYAYTLGSGAGEWTLKGAGRTATSQFQILAIRGAGALPNAGASGVQTWLEALRRAGNSNFVLAGIEQNSDGSEGAHHYADTIQRVCEASADFCRQLEREALEAEFLEKEPAKITKGDSPKVPRTELPEFPDRAAWLRLRLRERGWNKHDVSRKGGPDRKSVQKILDGRRVREDLLDKVAQALSKAPVSMKLPAVNLLDIPQS
jgi:hypothetical protein